MGIGTVEDLVSDPLFNHNGLSLFGYKLSYDELVIVIQRHKEYFYEGNTIKDW